MQNLTTLTRHATLIFVVLLIMVGGVAIMEWESKNILIAKGWIPSGDFDVATMYGQTGNGYRISQNTPGYRYRGLDTALRMGGWVWQDENGFITGDSLQMPKKKPAGEIRIFLTGGSAMYGSGQTRALIPDSSYPVGAYDFEASIAGRLQQRLRATFPEKNIRVINAAVVMYQFNQGFSLYYDKIHDYQPDLIINMDGYNDAWFSAGDEIDPYENSKSQARKYLDMEMMKRILPLGYTATLLSQKFLVQSSRPEQEYQREMLRKLGPRLARDIESPRGIPPFRHYPADSFKALEPLAERSIGKMMWLIDSYERQLRSDGVFSIFCLQATLSRQGMNKDLSPLEEQLFRQLDELPVMNRTLFTPEVASILKPSQDLIEAFASMGDAKCFLSYYAHGPFMNDFLSPKLDSLVRSHGAVYIDMGQCIDTMGTDKEFFTDFCHLTPYANQFIADRFAEAAEKYLRTKK